MDIAIAWTNFLTWLWLDRPTQILTAVAIAVVGGTVLYLRRKEARAAGAK